jgi:hypothetical protein
MAEPSILDFVPSFFKAGDTSDPRVNQALRQRIALQLMANKRAYPKNVGEGLSAIGEAIGDRGLAQQLAQSDVAAQDAAAKLGAGASTGTPGYAPTDTAVPPAVGAINSAISGGAPAAAATPVADMPVAPGAGPDEGGYNVLDAQAGGRFKPTPGYMQDTIAAREPNPDMQAYYGSLSGSEAKNARDVSPTGAAGPFQITRGTGRGLGLTPNQRFDPGASMNAVRDLTAQNAAVFQRINGRPPTFQELALMHQQGGVTGARMAAGTGNAPVGNLAVNNIPTGASPGQAVGQINRFYGMPNEPAPVRNGVAGALMAQQQPPAPGVPQPNPTLAGADGAPGGPPDQRLAFNGTPTPNGIQPAPPVPSGIRPAPPPQVAQAQQVYPPGYVPPQPDAPQGAPIIPMSQRERELRLLLSRNQGNPYASQSPAAIELGNLVEQRTARQNEVNEWHKAQIQQATEQAKLRLQGQMDQQQRIAEQEYKRAQTEKERLVEKPEEKYVLAPGGGSVRPLPIEGEDPNAMPSGTLTEDQRKTLVYHGWAKTGNQAITGNDQMLAHGLYQETLGKIPFVGNAAQQDAYRKAKNGADNFILAFMRSTSGAQYGATERLDHAKAMLPRYGDDAKTLADKAAQRQQFVDTEYAGLGKQGQKMADYIAKRYDPGSTENRQRLIDIEMQGVKGGQVGEVKTNQNPKSPDFGKQRLWNGTRWVEAK